jgi:hypothetical protein
MQLGRTEWVLKEIPDEASADGMYLFCRGLLWVVYRSRGRTKPSNRAALWARSRRTGVVGS